MFKHEGKVFPKGLPASLHLFISSIFLLNLFLTKSETFHSLFVVIAQLYSGLQTWRRRKHKVLPHFLGCTM